MFLIFQETSKLEQDVNCTVEDGTHPSITLTTNNVVTLGGKSESLDIQLRLNRNLNYHLTAIMPKQSN
jgi:hypothetical protein